MVESSSRSLSFRSLCFIVSISTATSFTTQASKSAEPKQGSMKVFCQLLNSMTAPSSGISSRAPLSSTIL